MLRILKGKTLAIFEESSYIFYSSRLNLVHTLCVPFHSILKFYLILSQSILISSRTSSLISNKPFKTKGNIPLHLIKLTLSFSNLHFQAFFVSLESWQTWVEPPFLSSLLFMTSSRVSVFGLSILFTNPLVDFIPFRLIYHCVFLAGSAPARLISTPWVFHKAMAKEAIRSY